MTSMLIVDDDQMLRTRLVRAFTDRGFAAVGAGSYEEALAVAGREAAARDAAARDSSRREAAGREAAGLGLALVDLRLPTRSGLEVVRGLKALDARTRIVVLTGYGSIATAVECVKAGAMTYRTKPIDADQILAAFEEPEASAELGASGASGSRASGGRAGVPSAMANYPAQSLARVEWEHIQRVLTDCGGNITRAARLLRIHRRSLQRKLNKEPDREQH